MNKKEYLASIEKASVKKMKKQNEKARRDNRNPLRPVKSKPITAEEINFEGMF